MRFFFYLLFIINVFASGTAAYGQAPSITNSTPARHTNIAPINTDVGVTFSQPIDASTASAVKVYSTQAEGVKKGSYSTDNTTLTFKPASSFKPGEKVSVSIPATVHSTANSAVKRQVYQFTTATGGIGRAQNFRVGPTLSAGGTCFGLATGDVDGDGDLDIVEINQLGFGQHIFVLLNTGNNGANTVSFTTGKGPKDDIGQARGVALVDVDGDSDLDIVAISDVVYVFLNGGDNTGSNTGVFVYSSYVQVGRGPYSVALGDVDGDGDQDVVTADENSSSISVRLNGGDGTGSNTGVFKNGSTINIGGYPTSAVLADVDNDGDLDILANNATNAVIIRLNGGDATGSNTGVFSGGQSAAVNGTTELYTSLAVGDVDGDGDIDFAMSTSDISGNSSVSVRLNGGDATGSGTGIFSGGQNIAVGAYGVAFGDVDADGDLDLALSTTNQIAFVRLNGGDATGSNTGVFSGGTNLSTGNSSYSVGLADMDGDGDLDVLTADYGFSGNGSTITIGLNQPPAPVLDNVSPTKGVAGTAVIITGKNLLGATVAVGGKTAVISNGTDTSLTFKVPAGANTSGLLTVTTSGGVATKPFTVEVLIVSTTPKVNSLNASVYNSNVTVALTEPATYNSATNMAVYSALAGGRKQGQTYPSGNNLLFYGSSGLSTTNFRPGEQVDVTVPASVVNAGGIGVTKRVYRFTTAVSGLGRGNFRPGTEVGLAVQPYDFTMADVDGDGDLDIIAATAGTTGLGNSLSVRLNTGNGTFTAGTNLILPGAGQGVRSIAAVDLDADGDLDLVTANAQTNNVSVLLNNGRGTFTAGNNIAVGISPRQVVAADVDGNGTQDLLVVNSGANTVSVRLNIGYGYFSGGFEIAVGDGALALATADVDGDGDLDLLTVNGSSNTISLRLNNGAGAFSGTTTIATGMAPSKLVSADVDADGDLDLLVASSGSDAVTEYLNNGTGAFSSNKTLTVGAAPAGLALADIDADRDLDLLTVNSNDNTVSVRFNDGTGSFSEGSTVAVGASPNAIALVDVDNDGDLDLLSANTNDNTISVRFNQAGTPTITSFTPASGLVGATITVAGTNLTGASALTLNGVSVGSFTVVDASTLTFVVPVGATSGLVMVTTPGGTATSATSFIVLLPTPTIASLAPGTIEAGSGDFTLTVVGTGFISGSVVNFGTTALPTMYGSATQLTAQVPASLVATAGSVNVAVANPSPEQGGTSAAATFSITAPAIPAPTLVSFTPGSGLAGTAVTVTGTNLLGATALTLNGMSVGSFTVVNTVTLTFVVPSGASSGLLTVTTPGGTATSASSFTVLLPNPAPTISSLSPASAVAGSGATTLTVTGTGYVSSSVLLFNGVALPTTFVSATQLMVTIPATALATAGFYAVVVDNPAPGGGTSPGVNFTVVTPAPTLVSFTPASGPVGTLVTVTGTDLTGATTVTLNGTPAAIYTVLNATSLTFTVPVGATSGLVSVTTPGGTATSATAFTVIIPNPVPTLASLSPNTVVAGSSAFTLALTGTGFGAGSAVLFNGTALATTYVSATQLTAQVPASALATAGSYDVLVHNPAPGGGTSAALAFVVTVPVPTISSFTPTTGGAGTLVTVTGTNLSGATEVRIGNALMPTFTVVSATSLTLVVPAVAGGVSGYLSITTPGGTATSTTAFSGVLAATSSHALAQVQVYPNPFQSKLTLVVPGPEPVKVLLRDITGRVVLPLMPLPASKQLALPTDLATGVYLLEIHQGDATTTRRLLKE